MSSQRLFIAEPPRLDPLRLQSPRFTIRATSPAGGCLVHFDPAQSVGAVQSLRDRQIVAPDSDDLATWVAACSQLPMADELN